jgi:tetratricopeptide (TPR) repeat protein
MRRSAVSPAFLLLLWTAVGVQPLFAESPVDLGDRLYARGEYDLARIEYERALGAASEADRRRLEARIGLVEIRRERYRSAIEVLRDSGDYSQLYLKLFAALRLGWQNQALVEADRIDRLPGADAAARGRAQLLLGLVFLDRADYTAARAHYAFLMKDSEADEVRQASARVLSELDQYEQTPQKSPWFAGSLSAVLPGAGQIYSEHYVDGVTAFFFNSMFLGSAAIMYDLEQRANRPHVASAAFGVVGVFFYLANVFGAAQSAHRYNTYQTRLFHQEVRDTFFNVDYIDRTSGIVFEVRF